MVRQLKPARLDAAARNALAEEWAPLVHQLAKRFYNQGPGRSLGSVEDCFQEGYLGLLRAAELFDPSMGNQFSTYAHPAIRNSMYRAAGDRRKSWRAFSPDYFGQDDDMLAWEEMVSKGRTVEPPDIAEDSETIKRIRRRLDPRSFRIVEAYFLERMTLKEIGVELGITRERVRQILAKAMDKVRAEFGSTIKPWTRPRHSR